MNWGSIAKPEGWGKPKIREVQPRQRSVVSRETPKASRKAWSQQTREIPTAERRKIFKKRGLSIEVFEGFPENVVKITTEEM